MPGQVCVMCYCIITLRACAKRGKAIGSSVCPASSLLVSFPDVRRPYLSREEKGLVYLGRILGSRSTARADPAMQSSDLIGLYGRTGD